VENLDHIEDLKKSMQYVKDFSRVLRSWIIKQQCIFLVVRHQTLKYRTHRIPQQTRRSGAGRI